MNIFNNRDVKKNLIDTFELVKDAVLKNEGRSRAGLHVSRPCSFPTAQCHLSLLCVLLVGSRLRTSEQSATMPRGSRRILSQGFAVPVYGFLFQESGLGTSQSQT